jgi:catalase
VVLGAGAVAAFLAVDLGTVAYANNWISPRTLTRQSFVDAFRAVGAHFPGFRLNHAKGVVVNGFFESTGRGAELSRAAVFRSGRSPVTGRFSLGGGNPFVADAPDTVRGLGLVFSFPDGSQWRTAMINLPVFPDNSPQGFHDRLLASKPVAGTGKPDPALMKAFLAAHPETLAAMAIIKKITPTTGFADSTFRALNTFHLVSESGTRNPVRWWLSPQQYALAPGSGDNALFDALVRQVRSGPLRWKLVLTVGTADDSIDPTVPWPDERQTIDAGTLTLTGAETERVGNARDINFDPLVLPVGIEPSDDPILSTRSAVYAASYRARSGRQPAPSAVQVDRVTP